MAARPSIRRLSYAAAALLVLLAFAPPGAQAEDSSAEARAQAAEKRAADAEKRAAAAERRLRLLQRNRTGSDAELERRHDQLLNQQLLRDLNRR